MDAHPATPGARLRAIALAALLALIALGLAWELWLAPTGGRTLALKVVPLALPLPGLLRDRLYTYRWLSLFVWLYFIEGVVRASGDGGTSALLAMIEVALCLLLFAACAARVRVQTRAAKGASA
jgi:uncharacterized membrane protein